MPISARREGSTIIVDYAPVGDEDIADYERAIAALDPSVDDAFEFRVAAVDYDRWLYDILWGQLRRRGVRVDVYPATDIVYRQLVTTLEAVNEPDPRFDGNEKWDFGTIHKPIE